VRVTSHVLMVVIERVLSIFVCASGGVGLGQRLVCSLIVVVFAVCSLHGVSSGDVSSFVCASGGVGLGQQSVRRLSCSLLAVCSLRGVSAGK